ncbi:hypothetical protein B0H13DRAFT_1924196 [Mycena leptocephala]|nr:hypothetical protein B0H13DRAFT_1924196 [Mycena leptocephala]
MHLQGLYNLALHTWYLGDHFAAKVYAHEAQRLARISANFVREAQALQVEANCLFTLGDYKQSISLCDQARDLLGLCSMSGGDDHSIMTNIAEVHKLKSEYVEARNIHTQILQEAPKDQDPYYHVFTLLNIAEIDVSISAPHQNVQRNIQTARRIFSTTGLVLEVAACDAVLADLYLREGHILAAEHLLEKCLRLSMESLK